MCCAPAASALAGRTALVASKAKSATTTLRFPIRASRDVLEVDLIGIK
jgi:hypothetical protein